MHRAPALLSLVLCFACDGASTTDAAVGGDAAIETDASAPPSLPATVGPTDRPARLVVPSAHDGVTPLPLLVLLHGYSASGEAQDLYLGLSRTTRTRGFYLVIPDGTIDSRGNRFWNATPACCNFDGSTVDDSAYLIGLVDEVSDLAPVRDVYFFGHSNGSFMSYRMACDHADRVTAIAGLAGSDFLTEAECGAAQPVSVLHIHGDMDTTIPYEGLAAAYPSAPEVVARWAARGGCDDVATPSDALDLETGLEGAETTVEHRNTNCTDADATLWTIVGGGHIPAFDRSFAGRLLDWLDAHRR